jgi:F-type H+-transporting ATPase subunit gamma
MNGSTQDLRRKISGAGELEGVVRAMKALAASSIGEYERAVTALDGYYRTVELGLAACFRQTGPLPPPTKTRHPPPVGAVIFGSDQGLVGRFNETLVEFAMGKLKALPGKTRKIWAAGDRMHALVADAGFPKAGLMHLPASVAAITRFVGRLLIEIGAARDKGEVVEVYVFHNRPLTGSAYEPASLQLLPLGHVWQNKLAKLVWPTKCVPEVMGGATAELHEFIRGYLFVVLFQACAESLASENASRLAAMQRAEKNIKTILSDLNRRYHAIRQEAIDDELFDVISGFEALKKNEPAQPVG